MLPQADPARFPSGMHALADYIHSKNLLFGVYTARNAETCQSRPASYQHEIADVMQYCEWGVDYIKIDQCRGAGYKSSEQSWTLFRKGITQCGATRPDRPMFMSVESCASLDGCGEWVGTLANSWRTAGDVMPVWSSILNNLYTNEKLWPLAGTSGPVGGHWNDADMLQLGNDGLSFEEQKSHYTLWALMCSPLLLGSDITNMGLALKTLLLNREIATLNQDPLGYPGRIAHVLSPTSEIWQKEMSGGATAAVLFNKGSTPLNITLNFSVLNISHSSRTVRDLWARRTLGRSASRWTALVQSHGVVALLLSA